MAIHCDILLRWEATPAQLTAVGTALWAWYLHGAADAGLYRYLDNQPLSDLIGGKLPAGCAPPGLTSARGYPFPVRDETSADRAAAIARLRRALPGAGIEDVIVAGKSWNLAA